MKQAALWLSYDLGVRGDYPGLYAWLDDQGASEAGDGVAFLKYRYDGDLLGALKDDLANAVQIDDRARIYAIYRDTASKKIKGAFLFGRRRSPPWTGYGRGAETQPEDEG